MSWLVIREFADAQDGLHVYKAGDSFPRNGMEVSEKRLGELASNGNAIGSPVIKEVVEERKTESKPKTAKGKSKTKE